MAVIEEAFRMAEVLCDLDHRNPVDRLPCKNCTRAAERDIAASQQRAKERKAHAELVEVRRVAPEVQEEVLLVDVPGPVPVHA